MAQLNGSVESSAVSIMDESGFFEESSLGSLKGLNESLTKYIKMVRDLEARLEGQEGAASRKTVINVKIDRKKYVDISVKYQKALGEAKDKVKGADDEIAKLMAKIAQLEAEIKILLKRNADKDASIWEIDLAIEKLKAELAQLEANLKLAAQQKEMYEKQIKALGAEIEKLNNELKTVIGNYAAGKSNSYLMGAKLRSLEKDLRFQASVRQSQLETESSMSKGDMTEINEAFKERYKPGLENQLQLLGTLFTHYTAACTTQMESLYQQKMTGLEAEIAGVPLPALQDEEFQLLAVQLENTRLRTREMETSNLQLVSKKTVLQNTMEERKKYINDQLSAKDKELGLLKDENDTIRKKYELLLKELDLKEVDNYSNILTPEIRRISRRFGSEASVNNSRTINYSYSDQVITAKALEGELSSDSDSDIEASKMKESFKSVTRNAQASASTVGTASVEAKKVEEKKAESVAVKASVKAEASEAVIKQTTQVSQKESVTTQQVSSSKKTSVKTSSKK